MSEASHIRIRLEGKTVSQIRQAASEIDMHIVRWWITGFKGQIAREIYRNELRQAQFNKPSKGTLHAYGNLRKSYRYNPIEEKKIPNEQ